MSKVDGLYAMLLTLALGGLVMCQSAPTPRPGTTSTGKAVYLDMKQSVDARARALLKELTLEEKVSLVHGDGQFSTAALARLGIPQRWMSDGPQGVREEIKPDSWQVAGWTNDFATALPAGIGIAATFDENLAKAAGKIIGEEGRTRGKQIMLCPGVNIMRTPLCGRNAEYFGEDPFVASRMGVGFIEGVQANGVAACVKHFALNNQEFQRNSMSVEVDERTLHEIYLPAFKAAVTEARVWTVMAAYNRFRGDFCSENDLLLNQILKQDWGFPGLVMSDWGGVHSTVKAANNGLDLEMGTSGKPEKWYFAGPLLEDAQKAKPEVSRERLDDMALRNLRVMVATGMADGEKKGETKPLMSPEHIANARQIAEAAIVLLKNEGTLLPLDAGKIRSIAVIGDIANTKFAHDGNSAAIKTAYEVTPLEGITKRAGEGVKVTYVRGYLPPGFGTGRGRGRGRGGAGTQAASAPATNPAATQADEAVRAAKDADVTIVVAGLYRAFDQEGADRRDMKLPEGQAELIQRVVAANPRTIVVLTGGGPVEMDPWLAKTPVLLQYWYGGTEGGSALARVVFGDVNPSGRLPCTFPKVLADSPAHTFGPTSYPGQAGKQTYAEGLLVGYRWFDAKKVEPQFAFGYGLSYTTFSLSDLKMDVPRSGQSSGPDPLLMSVQVGVTNTGSREGAQVVQLYVAQENPTVERPAKELRGFAKIQLKRGEKRTVAIPLHASAFTHYDPDRKAWVADRGRYTILVGDSSRNTPLQATHEIVTAISMADAMSPTVAR